MKRWTSALILTATILSVGACDLMEATYEPTEADIHARLSDFVSPSMTELRPFYGNADVDSVIATYCARQSSVDAVGDVFVRAQSKGWRSKQAQRDRIVLERLSEGRYERVDARLVSHGRCVALAWLQTSAVDEAAFEKSSEGDWARSELRAELERAARGLEAAN